MNILFVSESRGSSGGATQMLLTALHLLKKGHKVFFAVPLLGGTGKKAAENNFKVIDLNIKQDYDILSAFKIKKICSQHKIDLVHAHHPQAHAVCLLSKFIGLKTPLIVTRRVIFKIRKNPFSKIKYASKKINAFIAVCNATKDELTKGGVKPNKIFVVPSAVDISKFETAYKINSSKEFKPPFKIGLVGHYSWFKGHDYLIKATPSVLKEFPDTKFVFIGRDTEKLMAQAKELGVEKSVELLGERHNIPELLTELHLFVMPSLQEGIATALMEAQSAGLAAVVSDAGGIPDVLINGKTGLMVPKADEAALADAIIKALKNPNETKKMRQAGYERVKENFTIEVVINKLENLYKKIVFN